MEETKDYSKHPPNAVKSAIAKAATLDEAEAIFAQAKPTPMAVAAIEARRAGLPVMSSDKPRKAPAAKAPKETKSEAPVGAVERIVVVGADRQADVVHGLVRQAGGGIPALRDFNERHASATQVPAWLRTILDAHEPQLEVARIATEELANDPRTSGPETYMVPVTRDTLPAVPDRYFNERGVMVWKDQTWCVGLKENFERARTATRAKHAGLASSLAVKRRETTDKSAPVKGPIDMGIAAGLRVKDPLKPGIDTGQLNKSLDKALAGG